MSDRRHIVSTYDYRNPDGDLLYQIVRYEPKDFRPRRPDGFGGWKFSLAGVPRVLYRLPELLAAPEDRPVYFVEGEKDVETLADLGVVATTVAGGSNTKLNAALLAPLRGRGVILVPDNDEPGRAFMRRVADMLHGVAKEISWLELPGVADKGDVSDWFALPGRNLHGFYKLPLSDVPHLTPSSDDGESTSSDSVRETRASKARINPRRDIVKLEDLDAKPVEWLWKPWLPVGKLCLIDGDPGQGKSYMTLDLAARLSRGHAFPDDSRGPGKPITTLLISCEDGLSDTVLPRLDAMGADRRFIRCYQGERQNGHPIRLPVLPDDLDNLEAIIVESKAMLVVIDPLMAFLGASVNSISDQSVRQVLTPLAGLAEKLGVTILFVRHLNKSNGTQAIYRGGGSIGIIAAMRTAMLIARHPHDRDQRVLAMVKCNLGKEPASLGFRLVASERDPEATEVKWLGPVELQANDLVGDVKDTLKPKDWLKLALADGPRLVTDLQKEAADEGYSEKTIDRAKAALGIIAKQRKSKDGKRAWWWLPPGQNSFGGQSPLEAIEELRDMDEIPGIFNRT